MGPGQWNLIGRLSGKRYRDLGGLEVIGEWVKLSGFNIIGRKTWRFLLSGTILPGPSLRCFFYRGLGCYRERINHRRGEQRFVSKYITIKTYREIGGCAVIGKSGA